MQKSQSVREKIKDSNRKQVEDQVHHVWQRYGPPASLTSKSWSDELKTWQKSVKDAQWTLPETINPSIVTSIQGNLSNGYSSNFAQFIRFIRNEVVHKKFPLPDQVDCLLAMFKLLPLAMHEASNALAMHEASNDAEAWEM